MNHLKCLIGKYPTTPVEHTPSKNKGGNPLQFSIEGFNFYPLFTSRCLSLPISGSFTHALAREWETWNPTIASRV